MAEKVTTMVLKVDLQCPRCYKKIKKILCQIPQIRDRKFDEVGNTVQISVICCSPEKIRQKLFSKGGKTIKAIDIVVPLAPPKKEEPFAEFPRPVYGSDWGSRNGGRSQSDGGSPSSCCCCL